MVAVEARVLRDRHLVQRLSLGQLRGTLVRSVDTYHMLVLLVRLWSPRQGLVTE